MVHINKNRNNIIPKENKPQKQYPQKDIGLICLYHSTLREASVEELFESLFGEHNNLPLKLERYGENSLYWKNSEPFVYEKDATKGKAPSAAWLRAKVQRYEHETSI